MCVCVCVCVWCVCVCVCVTIYTFYSDQVQKHDYFSWKTILKPISSSYMRLCVVKYAFSTATYRSALKAQ